MTDVGKLGRLSLGLQEKLRAWRNTSRDRDPQDIEDGAEKLFLRARAVARSGDRVMALRLYQDAVEADPTFADAIEAQAELLEQEGDADTVSALYARARLIRSQIRQGLPDRHYAARQRGRMTSQIVAYNSVLRSLSKNALPYLTRGNAHLANGSPAKALEDYQAALRLKPTLVEAELLKAEALMRLGRYSKAIESFDSVLLNLSSQAFAHDGRAFAHGGRAIAWMALGELERANADFDAQARLTRLDAPLACIHMRKADYSFALRYIDVIRREKSDAYWDLYAATCEVRLGRLGQHPPARPGPWPAPLLALYGAGAEAEHLLGLATTSGRRAETLFQLGIAAVGRDRLTARKYFAEVTEVASPEMIEFSAAKNELARL